MYHFVYFLLDAMTFGINYVVQENSITFTIDVLIEFNKITKTWQNEKNVINKGSTFKRLFFFPTVLKDANTLKHSSSDDNPYALYLLPASTKLQVTLSSLEI